MNRPLPFISLMVATLNGGNKIARTLDGIFAQDYPLDRYEVIVIIDGSTDNTQEVVKSYPRLKVVNPGYWQGIPGARNAGLAVATGDIVIGTDDDTLLPINLFKEIAAAYRAKPDAAAIASILTEPPVVHGLADHYMAATGSGNPPSVQLNASQSIWKRFTSYVKDQIRPRHEETEIYQVSRVYGATATFPMDVLRAVGGWDPTMHWVEDSDISERIARKFPNRPFYATPKTQVVHDPKMSLWKMWRRAYKRGPQNLAFYRKFNLVPPVFPFPLAFLASLLISLVINPALLPVAIIVMPMLFVLLVASYAQSKSARPLYFALPYVQLGEELASLSGMIRGYIKLIGIRPMARQLARQFKTDSLFRNAVYLMTSTAVMSVLGFGFWLFVAHFYTPSAIGAASALISVSLLIGNFSYLGIDSGLLRFLPSSKDQAAKINTALIVVGALTAIVTLVYAVLGLGTNLPFFETSLLTKSLLAILVVIAVLNSLTDNVFIANRRAGFHTITYAVLGTTKLILPLFLVSLGSLGIFGAYVGSAGFSLLLTFAFMRKAAGYRFFTKPDWKFIKTTRNYATANYLARLASGLPSQLMPMLIVTRMGAANAAYFSMAWTMSNLLYVIPSATSNSLLAESSADESSHKRHLSHSAKMLSVMLVPAVVAAVLVAPYLLQLFGPSYAAHGTLIFQIMAGSTFFVAINYIGTTMLNVARRTRAVVILQAVIATVILGLSFPLMRYGLAGVGIAFLIGQIAGNIALLLLLRPQQIRRPKPASPSRQVLEQFGKMYGLGGAWFSNDLGGGDRSATVIVSQGRAKYVLKVGHIKKRDLVHTTREVDFMEFLRGQGIPVPRIIANNQDQLVSTLENESGSWTGVLMSYVEGHHPENLNATLITSMAEIQGRIHQAGIKYMAQHPDVKLTQSKSTLLPIPKGLSHFDFYHSNIFVRGNRIVSIVDFEGMRADSLIGCIGYTLTWLHEESATKSDLESYLAAYQTVRKLQWLERQILRVALALRRRSLRLLALKF